MAINKDGRQAFFKGQNCWRNNDYINARYWFEIAFQHSSYREESLSKLIQIEIREGKYAKAREILTEHKDLNSILLKQIWGLLENIENNFETSKKHYSECMINPYMQNKSLLALAKLYIQTGDNVIARKMLETLQLNNKFNIQSTFGLVGLNILEKNYEDAYNILNTIDEYTLTSKHLQHYRILNAYLLFMLGKLKSVPNNFDPVRDYMIYRLFDSSEEMLLNHISKHTNQQERNNNGCFFEYIDLKKLLNDARDKIETMNSNHFEVSDMYRFRLDTPIGYKGDEITSDLCVVTMIGTKDIVTMYPVQLSSEFDSEGFTHNEAIALKRTQGGIKK
ncbi:MAG: tetratricopeptide repeat protein [Bacilli bacterium]